MSTDTKVANLIINKGLTKAELNEKYQQGLIGDNELSIVDTEENVVQVDEMPVASASNVNSIVQFSGETTENYTNGYFYKNIPEYSDPTVTASQTSGSDLSDITVDKDVYIETMQPEEGDSVSFVADVMDDYVTPTSFEMGGEQFTLEMSTFLNYCKLNVYSGDWSAYVRTVSVTYDADNNMWSIAAKDAGYNILGDAAGMSPQNAGIMYNALPSSGNYTVNLTYTPQRLAWRVDGTILAYDDLSSVGISYTGTPVTGDTITATYTGRTISGYYWTQINVQPGGGAGIEWETIVDLPATYSAGAQFACPQFVVQGGLPDGNYEFYYQVKTQSNSGDQTAPFGVATYKIVVRIFHNNGQPYMAGSIAPVIDGNWMPSSNYRITELSVYGCFYEDSGNFVIWSQGFPFITDIGDLPNTFVPGCFKLSAIKNTDTGDKYIATGTEPDGQQPSFSKQYYNSLRMDLIQAHQSLPSYFNMVALNYGSWCSLSGTYITVDKGFPSYCSECDISLVSSGGGKWHIIAENTPDSYKISLLEASGDLTNVQIGYNESGNTILYINTPSGTTGSVTVSVGVKGSTWTDMAISEIGQPDNFTQFIVNTVGGDISTNNYGSILQYTGVTDSNYTNGYFYKASGTQTMAPASMLCNETSGLGLTITCNDVEGFVTALATAIGWSREGVQNVLKHQVTFWEYTQSSNRLNWNYYGDVDSSLINYFDIAGPEVPASTVIQWTTSNYVAEGIVITNPSWDRVDVQPAADPLPSQTGNAGKFLTTDGTAASWSDKPLVNKDTSNAGTGIGIGGSAADLTESVRIGVGATAPSSSCTVVGYNANSAYLGTAFGNVSKAAAWGVAIGNRATNGDFTSSVAIGNSTLSSGERAIAIGGFAQATANYSIMINASGTNTTNSDANTFKVANHNGNFEIMSADGTIPEARLADTTNATAGQVLTLDSNLNAVWQAGGGGSSYTAGTGIDITNDVISVTAPTLTNTSNRSQALGIIGNAYESEAVSVGAFSSAYKIYSVAIGTSAHSYSEGMIAIGRSAGTYGEQSQYSIAIGTYANIDDNTKGAIQLGRGTNSTSGTFAVGLSTDGTTWNNYELLSADGTVPTARLTKVNTTITLTAAGWSSNTQTVSVTGMTATGVVFVSPDPTDQADYTSAGILCTAQAAGTLTFTCDTVPSGDIDVVVVML